jgi:riboflavin kinase/FMN adenylyltransferase
LDFQQDIYSENIRLRFIEKVRDEFKFSNTDELKEAIDKDKININNILQQEITLYNYTNYN